ncbi:MAG: CBS domain-containing protein [Gammaproteobacteria bacterium]|nr:CBS domain-containing protein [Gammaproteobacteria bacterium]MCZ6578783.1 CBS domain-containing protein [Gammaproteobacteria bacterium]MCZ6797882.1 CBS domain-containing protein [Gammaproteobacteria bacterium]MCZ6881799.1 CBS domain-containing protein [Gammaproteobacteria bacterium]
MAYADNGGSTKGLLERVRDVFSGEPQDQKQLQALLKNLQVRQLIGAEELFMIEGVLQVSDMQVRDIMIPRGQMIVLDHEDSFADIIEKITESGHSRFPVIDDDKDDVVGILLAKDLLQLSVGASVQFEINEYIRPASFIPESKRLNVLLKEFRQNRSHMAMIVDEYGGVSGLVTIEDVLEQIVGKIDDEHDDDDEIDIQHHGANRYSVRALTPLQDFNDYFKSDFINDEIETIGGYLLGRIGHLPERGESLTLQNLTFKVLSADSRQVHLYQVVDDNDQSTV